MNIQQLVRVIQSEDPRLSDYVYEIVPAIQRQDCNDQITVKTFVFAFTEFALPELGKCSNEFGDVIADICEACLLKGNTEFLRITERIFEETKLIRWEKRQDQAARMVRSLTELVISTAVSEADVNVIKSCISKMLDVFTKSKLASAISDDVMRVLITCYSERSKISVTVGSALVECYDLKWKASTDQVTSLYNGMFQWLQELDLNKHSTECNFFCGTISCLENEAILAPVELNKIYNHCISKELDGKPFSGYGSLAQDIIWVTVNKHHSRADMIKDFIPGTVLLMNCGVKALEDAAGGAISHIYHNVDLLVPCADDVLQAYLDGKGGLNLGIVLKPLYQAAPERIIGKIDQINECFEDMDDIEKTYLYVLLDEIAKKYPQKLLPIMPIIVKDLRSASNVYLAFLVITKVSATYPEEISKYYKKLLQAWDRVPDLTCSAAETIANIGLMSEDDAYMCLRAMAKRLKKVGPEDKSIVLMEMNRIGGKYKDLLERYRTVIEAEQNSSAPGHKNTVKHTLDLMESGSLESIDDTLKDHPSKSAALDACVACNTRDLHDLTREMESDTSRVESVQSESHKLNRELELLEKDEAATLTKGSDIDQKTIINKIPEWSRDIAEILNVEGDFDWRYLAIRLGYSGEDVRNWVLSPDPTVAVLADWYATHKSSDATFAILTALQDMGQNEAAELVEKALKAADKPWSKQSDDFSEEPYPVFISYQWDHQPEVKVIKDHLEMAGYKCWMDTGQNGSGDQRLSKISEGMRGCKIVLCMVTMEYTKCANCCKEVNLANLLNKPIIPILIEDISWPPKGSMSMFFAQLLHIRFYCGEDYIRVEQFWPTERFNELLGRIGYYASPQIGPDEGDKNEDRLPTLNIANDIFLSFQWDDRSKVVDFRRRLVESGFSCWLTPLRPEHHTPSIITTENAIRKTKVFLACLSTKYFMSSDCKHQFNFADALNKTILLVLFDEELTWPIVGPISLSVSKLDYADVRDGMTDEKYASIVKNIKHFLDPLKRCKTNEGHQLPKKINEEESTNFLPLEDGSDKSGNEIRTRTKQVYSKPQPSAYIKPICPSESSRSFPEQSPSFRRRPPHHRANSDQGVAKQQLRRSAICGIL